jgi:hypothetical protein
MKISYLDLNNFRNHVTAKFDFDRFTFIVGANAVGKSSISMAIETLLTGRCAVTDAKGAGAEELVTLGAKEFSICGQVGKQSVCRTNGGREHSITIGGKIGPVKEMQELIYRGLNTTADVLSAVLNSGRFLAMDVKAQKQLLAQVLASDPPKIPKGIYMDLSNISFVGFEGQPINSIADVDALYKHAFDLRTQANRNLKEIGVIPKPERPEDMPTSAAVWKQADDLRSELTKLTSNRARAEERWHADERNFNETNTRLHERKRQAEAKCLSKEDREFAEKTAGRLEEAAILVRKIDQCAVLLQNATIELVAQRRQAVADLTAQINVKDQQLQELDKIRGKNCPICSHVLGLQAWGDLKTKLAEEMDTLTRHLEEAQLVLENAGPPEDEEARKDFELLESRLKVARQALEEIGDVAAAENLLRIDREAAVEVGRCERDLKAVKPVDIPVLTDFDEKIAVLNERIGKGEAILEQVRDFDRQEAAYETWTQTKETLEARIVILDRLVEFFGPNGVKASMVGDKIEPFTKAMNAVMNPFGYYIHFTLEPYSFGVGQDPLSLVGVHQLSKSEAFRFSIAFQIALAMATGLKFVVIDEADILDNESRSALTGMILKSDLDQAIVLSTSDNNPPDPAQLPEGVKFIQLGATRNEERATEASTEGNRQGSRKAGERSGTVPTKDESPSIPDRQTPSGKSSSSKQQKADHAPDKKTKQPKPLKTSHITEPQRLAFFTEARKIRSDLDESNAIVKSCVQRFGFETSRDVTTDKYDAVLGAIKSCKP